MSVFTRTLGAVKATGQELVGLLVDDWLLFFGTVGALAAASAVADAETGSKLGAGVLLFGGIWVGLFVSLRRAARLHRDELARVAVPEQAPVGG